ncbi:MAG: hypothetical protein RL379_490, partial [Bacillota bacterium]
MLKFLSVIEAVQRLKSGEKILLVDDEKLDSPAHYAQLAEAALKQKKVQLLHAVPGMVMLALGFDKYATITNSLKDANNDFIIPMTTVGALDLGYALNANFFESMIKALVSSNSTNENFRFDV